MGGHSDHHRENGALTFMRTYAELGILLLALAAGIASLWIRAQMADIERRVAILENHQFDTTRRLDEIKTGVDKLIDMHLVPDQRSGNRNGTKE